MWFTVSELFPAERRAIYRSRRSARRRRDAVGIRQLILNVAVQPRLDGAAVAPAAAATAAAVSSSVVLDEDR
jgi:hypothetical protein